ncbi:hypothetical protein AB1N83_013922 [Pleurotus pulmonarius]
MSPALQRRVLVYSRKSKQTPSKRFQPLRLKGSKRPQSRVSHSSRFSSQYWTGLDDLQEGFHVKPGPYKDESSVPS